MPIMYDNNLITEKYIKDNRYFNDMTKEKFNYFLKTVVLLF